MTNANKVTLFLVGISCMFVLFMPMIFLSCAESSTGYVPYGVNEDGTLNLKNGFNVAPDGQDWAEANNGLKFYTKSPTIYEVKTVYGNRFLVTVLDMDGISYHACYIDEKGRHDSIGNTYLAIPYFTTREDAMKAVKEYLYRRGFTYVPPEDSGTVIKVVSGEGIYISEERIIVGKWEFEEVQK